MLVRGACAVAMAVTLLWNAAPAVASPRVSGLTAERAVRPLGIDAPRPELAWSVRSNKPADRQLAYRVLVATDPDLLSPSRADVWDSGRIESDRSYGVAYAGPELRSRTRYHWRVQVWTGAGARWSAPAWWETGLLEPSDWRGARWIGAPAESAPSLGFDGASWMWFDEGDPTRSAPAGTRYFRGRLEIPAGKPVQRAELLTTVDDQFTTWLNGVRVAQSDGTWESPVLTDITPRLQPGENVLAIEARNANFAAGGPSPAGVLTRVRVWFEDGTVQTLEGGPEWTSAQTAPEGWQLPEFDDGAWPPARVIAAWPAPPWGRVLPPVREAPAPLLRRRLDVTKPVARARLYVSGAAYADVSLNGRRVSDDVLAPGFTRYDKRVQYMTLDVTQRLRRGDNVIGAELGRGFFGMTTRSNWLWHVAPWHGEPRMRLLLDIRYRDGTSASVVSDEAWRWHAGPTRSNSLFAGETYDARFELPGWDRPGYAENGWLPVAVGGGPAGTPDAQQQEAIRVIETLRPTSVTEPKPGVHVFTLPRNIAGWARVRVAGPAGTRISLAHGERLAADGTLARPTGIGVSGRFQTDELVLSGDGERTWEPRFSYKGFQYVQVTGWPGEPTVDDLDGRVVHTDLADAGEFDSSSELLDRIRTITRHTVLNQMHGLPASTPMFEKAGWTGDMLFMTETSLYEFDMDRLLIKWLDDIRDSVNAAGRPPAIAPDNGWGQGFYAGAPPWGAAYVLIPWMLYERRGDRRVLTDHYDAMKRYVDYLIALAPDGIHGSVLNDYLAPGYVDNTPEDGRIYGTGYAFEMAQTLGRAAVVLGRAEDAARYRDAAATIRDAFNRTFLAPDGDHYRTATDPGYRQSSNAMALAFGLVPPEREDAVVQRLVRDIHERGDHLNTGAIGTQFLLPVLTDHGHGDLAYRIATQRTYPSWGYWIDNGATAWWERWDLGARSRDHMFLGGAIDAWFFSHLAGIAPAAPGYDRIDIAPTPVGDLTAVSASTRTPHGPVAVRWRDRSHRFRLDVEIPFGATAVVRVPIAASPTAVRRSAGRFVGVRDGFPAFEVGSGRHRFEVTHLE
jgi:alpha-L-rhamnosidase